MTNNEILTEYFIWEENNSIEPKMKSENKTESELNDSITNTKIVNELENWKTITDPKLRKMMRKREHNRRYREKHKEEIKKYKKTYRVANKNKIKTYGKTYFKTNKHKIKDRKSYQYKTDIKFKLSILLRCRLSCALKNNQKNGSAVRDLGCSIPELKTYLESKFQPGMTWDNHGNTGWHIDHIKPLASFDLSDRKQLLEACHYTNLQPLWAKDNLSKGNKSILT